MNEKMTDLELEAVHLRGRVAELERIVKAQEDELGKLRGHDGALSEREWRVLDMWPRFEDGEPVMPGDETAECGEVSRVCVTYKTAYFNESHRSDLVRHPHGERVKRPAPEVLDADGVPIKIGDTVYMLDGDWCGAFPCIGIFGGDKLRVSALTSPHGDGRLICFKNEFTCYPKPKQLTHRAPDSWEKLEEDAGKSVCNYFGRFDEDVEESCVGCPAEHAHNCVRLQLEDIMRRAKKLAGVE